MATYTVTEKFENRGGTAEGNEGKRSIPINFRRIFQVVSSDPHDSIKNILKADGGAIAIPRIWSQHPEDKFSLLKTKEAKEDDVYTWTVECNYVNVMMQGGGGDGALYPWDMPAEIHYGTEPTAIVAEYSYHVFIEGAGAPFADSCNDFRNEPTSAILNSANMPFDPPIMRERNLLCIQITRNVKGTDFKPNNIPFYKDTCNYDPERVAGVDIPIYCGLMKDYTAVRKWFTGVPPGSEELEIMPYFQEQFQIIVNMETWVRKILDCGLSEYKYNSDTHKYEWFQIMDSSKPPKPVQHPVPLYQGEQFKGRPVGDPNFDPDVDSPKYLLHKLNSPEHWLELNLPKEAWEEFKVEDEYEEGI